MLVIEHEYRNHPSALLVIVDYFRPRIVAQMHTSRKSRKRFWLWNDSRRDKENARDARRLGTSFGLRLRSASRQ